MEKINLMGSMENLGHDGQQIADQSYTPPGLSVNFFSESETKLPHVMSSGDIICLHRVVIKIYDAEVYCAFHKKFSSFALFEGKGGSSFIPYQASHNFHAMRHDADFIKKLRTWLLDYQPDLGAKNYSLQLKEIKVGLEFDLICKVLHVCEIGEDSWMLFVWDGTDCPPMAIQTELRSRTAHPLQLESSSLPVDVLRLFPHVGSVLRITAGKSFKEVRQLVFGSHWFKFRKITCANQSGVWKGMLQSLSKVSLLSDEDESVLLRERNYNERITSDLLRRPMSCFPRPSCVTETDYSHLVDATLMDSLTHPEVTHKCKCVVRVVAACPWRAENLLSSSRGQYRLRLTLEDPTARIHAYICEEDGVKFFGDDPSIEDLERKMSRLLGISREVGSADLGQGQPATPRDPPWVSVCLKSYCLDFDRPWESRKYRIFGTRLLD
ncbi:unnamed protein product [Spirodela intermedia]|uniref:Uncharacterized protein n=1 Tax=Spirodela intermedia TaxID=51605 RepID=A0A7I8IN38_SPIIN|nr:unnamed protein product [Spirodela intermedia]CAA6659190.1 unnamed protein product [Spirodela intermedia]